MMMTKRLIISGRGYRMTKEFSDGMSYSWHFSRVFLTSVHLCTAANEIEYMHEIRVKGNELKWNYFSSEYRNCPMRWASLSH